MSRLLLRVHPAFFSSSFVQDFAPPCLGCSQPTEKGHGFDVAWYCTTGGCRLYQSRFDDQFWVPA